MVWFTKSEQIVYLDFRIINIEYINDIYDYLSEVNIFYICHFKILIIEIILPIIYVCEYLNLVIIYN